MLPRRYAGLPSVSRPYKDSFDSSSRPTSVASQNSTHPCAITTFPQSRCLCLLLVISSSVYISYFLLAVMNLRPPSVTVSTHTLAFNTVAFQSPDTMLNARMLLCTQLAHSFSFPPRHLCTAPSRFPNTIRFGSTIELMYLHDALVAQVI